MAEPKRPVVMISSTALDLPDHRREARDACLRADMFPEAMETRPASDADALAASLAMVDRADIYVGIFAYRYGHVPAGKKRSITHLEYERAIEQGIPVLAFLIHDDHPVRGGDVETGGGAEALQALKAELEAKYVVAYFKSPADLRAHVIEALSQQRREDETEAELPSSRSMHFISDIPSPPQSYVAHPYTLLQTRGLIGRRGELEHLTDWILHPERFRNASVLTVVGIGGTGKSALTWHWYSEVVAQEMRPLAGRIWWSFYESDASFENFLSRTLAYVSGRDRETVEKLPRHEREEELLQILDREPFVLVLDGLERLLIAYSGMRAAYVRDEELEDAIDAQMADRIGLPTSAGQSYLGRHHLRKTIDPRVGIFIRKLSRLQSSRVLMSTRLHPVELQTATGEPLPGCAALFLEGLSEGDALELWRAHGARGSRQVMLPVFQRFARHPLLIQVLAGEVARHREAPGDFDAWHLANPSFDPFVLPLKQARSHVLATALSGLAPQELRTLHVLAGFRLPTGFDTLKALLVNDDEDQPEGKPFASLGELDATLDELEDRGLLGWDRHANRYDLHPIVRGVAWNGLGEVGQAEVYTALQAHFEAVPAEDEKNIERIEDLSSGIELFNSLVGLKLYDEARNIFASRLSHAMYFRLSASRQRIEMLESLFPDDLDAMPRLSTARHRSWTLNELAMTYDANGQPGSALLYYQRAEEISRDEDDNRNLSVGLANTSDSLCLMGNIFLAASKAWEALQLSRESNARSVESVALQYIGNFLAVQADEAGSEKALQRSLRIWIDRHNRQGEGLVNAFLAQRALRCAQPKAARPLAERAWKLAAVKRNERDFIHAARLQGSAALADNDLPFAQERLNLALSRARACHLIMEEVPTLTAMAELHRRQGNPDRAREYLAELWEYTERGPYPLFEADARNVLARIEQDAGNHNAATKAARKAYTLAWCDGPPWAYEFGLNTARQRLKELEEPEPELEPFDASKFDPLPEVELDPDDEYHAGRKPESLEE
ncbi:MAG: DUF4062 domain-containing protein [bacterium]|nr:DUF4062 domain-containing protein [bacterium]